MLSDCISKNPLEAELFIVRRGKAATIAKSVRDRNNQAVLAVDRRIIDATDGELDGVLDNACAQDIVAALGVGLDFDDETSAATLRLDRIRYGKIILAFDDSPQGKAIQEAVLAFIRRYIGPVLKEGYVYTLTSPFSVKDTEAEFQNAVMATETWRTARVLFQGPEP